MAKLEIQTKEYRVWFEPERNTVFLEGSLRLNTAEYKPISDLLTAVLEQSKGPVTLHVRELSFLNSSGINTLYKFAIAIRSKASQSLLVRGNESVPWQPKTLVNIKRFLPTAKIEMN